MKNIRSNFVKESLIDYENLAETLKENTTSAVRDLLGEAVRKTYEDILKEEDEKEYEEEEVKDTESEDTNDAENTDDSVAKETDEVGEVESDFEAETPEIEDGEMAQEEPMETPEVDGQEAPVESDGDEWAEFDKYKVSDDEYDFSQADDEEIVKVYKLLKDEDQVLVNVDKGSNKVELKDNETGAEYLLDLSSLGGGEATSMEGETDDMGAEGDFDYNEEENMNESRIFEIALNEYDSHVGYTDNYQSKDVMTNPGMSEPGKNVNDWDAGVPKDTKKPWAGKGSNKPFEKKGATTVESEDSEEAMSEEPMTEGAGRFGMVQKRTKSKKHVGTNDGEDEHPEKTHELSTSENGLKAEAKLMAKANKIFKENKQLKEALGKFKNVLQEAAVTNLNLGQIIKLISENSTTKAEKQEIIARFGKEATTIEESKKLYSVISNELKRNNTMNITEDKQFTTSGSKMINETQIYQSKDLLDSLDLMHRIC